MLDKKIEAFIREKAGDVRHSGRTFYDHLIGVYDLLESIGAAEHVCLAGLFHSIYGTNAFRHQAVSLDERHDVAKLIGYPAERLAYIFCSCARPKALIEAVDLRCYFVKALIDLVSKGLKLVLKKRPYCLRNSVKTPIDLIPKSSRLIL